MPANEVYSESASTSPEAPRPAGHDPSRDATGRLRQEIDATYTALRRSWYAERQAIGLSIFEGAFRLGTFVFLGALGLAVALSAAALLVVGSRRGLALWTGGAWWSDIMLAFGLALAVAAIAQLVRRGVRRSVSSSTRRQLAQAPSLRRRSRRLAGGRDVSREQEELRSLARREREFAWTCPRRIRARAGDAARAFARQYPGWALGGAAAVAMGLMARRKRRRSAVVGRPARWPMALLALGVEFLPGVLRLAGLTSSDDTAPDEMPDRAQGTVR